MPPAPTTFSIVPSSSSSQSSTAPHHSHHLDAASSSSTVPSSSPPLPASARYHSVARWSMFIDNYDITAASILKHFSLLANIRDLATQRRLVEEVEQEIFDGKQQIEEIEAEVHHFPYNLREKAQQQIETHKEELESHYALLLHYQSTHRQGQPVTLLSTATASPWMSTDPRPPEGERREHEDDETMDDDTSSLLPMVSSSSSQASTSSPSSSSSSSYNNPAHANHRSALLSTSAHISSASSSIDRTTHHLTESSMIGTETSLSLLQQRESLMKQRDHLYATQHLSRKSRDSMERIRRRVLSDHLLAWCVVCLQIGLFTLIAYVKYFR